jgi:spore cortex formation protein SpoVR/YcgB (stage V sporulation)
MQKRSIEEMDLFEVSVLSKTPAYIATSIESRGEDDSVLTETRIEDFQAKIEDNSSKTEDKTEKQEETKKQEESRKAPEPHYFEHLEKEAILLQLKGGN